MYFWKSCFETVCIVKSVIQININWIYYFQVLFDASHRTIWKVFKKGGKTADPL